MAKSKEYKDFIIEQLLKEIVIETCKGLPNKNSDF